MVKVKRLLLVFVIFLYGCFIYACKGNVDTPKDDDTKVESTRDEELSGGETLTSKKGDEADSEESTEGKEEGGTSDSGDVTTGNEGDTTTNKQDVNKDQPTTTTGKQNSNNNKTTAATTTKPPETTTKKPAQTTPKATPAGGYSGTVISIPTNEFVPSEAAKTKAKAVVGQIINSSMNEYDRVKAIHDYIVKYVNYDLASIQNGTIDGTNHPSHTAEGALCKNLAVCDGYAQAFELLCAEAGIYAYMMYGEGVHASGDKESHAWNVVKINGEWYQVDCTWDDPIVNGAVVGDGSNITYVYFLLTDSEMYADHILDTTWSKNAKKCTSTLFMGTGLRLSLETAMDYPGEVLSDINSFYQKTTAYLSGSTFTFSLAVPVAESNKLDATAFKNAVSSGVAASTLKGSCEYGYSAMQVGNYVVYNICIKNVSN